MKVVQFGKHQPEPPSHRTQAVPHRQWPQYKGVPARKSKRWGRSLLPILFGGGVVAGFIGLEVVPPLVGCNVKGNISYNGGQKIYHVPGQKYYRETKIDWLKGDRWFCSEMAARQAGWRRSGI